LKEFSTIQRASAFAGGAILRIAGCEDGIAPNALGAAVTAFFSGIENMGNYSDASGA
jgi:hypothetical protein